MRTHAAGFDEEAFVERHPGARLHVDLRDPSLDAVRVELVVPGRVETVREVDSPAVAAHFHHLRSAVQRPFGPTWMGVPADDPTEPDGAHLPRLEWIRH